MKYLRLISFLISISHTGSLPIMLGFLRMMDAEEMMAPVSCVENYEQQKKTALREV
jgi:hypothetical protein